MEMLLFPSLAGRFVAACFRHVRGAGTFEIV